MTGPKGAFLLIVLIAAIVYVCLVLDYVPKIQLTNTKRRAPLRSIMLSNISRVEGRLHSSDNVKEASNKTMMRNDVTVVSRKRELSKPSPGHCFYKIQVYDKGDKLAKHRPALESIVRQSKGSPDIRANVSCLNDCIVEISIAGEKNKFAGMDAVVFHFMKNLIPKPQPPASMNPDQTWVYFSWESPRSNRGEVSPIAQLPVNAVWTYYRGSDITTPYGFYDPGTPMAKETKSADEWLQGKSKLALWMASNCKGTFWPRSDFVRELQKYVPVDVYGACGKLKCSPSWSTKCTVDLVRQYKFYLSLENAECEDYITEKLWNKPLMQGVVPIVYGPRRKVYEELLPPKSFIYIGDYKSIKELADYLKLLDSKPEMYIEYLKWQYEGSVGVHQVMHESYDPALFCNLIPFIDKVKRGQLKRTPVGESSFSKTCRKGRENKEDNYSSTFGLGKWNPW
ncbi:alpha-(1,3)-fucosyltransferase 7-like [Patiria miniata]|uniref:Fucosyltransferase n=1 Tax=Patiria miniata TaxID=46514 RepID=A0A913ZFD9_PATMI|nr:alpha-(1,3)-fucosyltransferase 7-like [Patiria miniata]